MTTTYVVLDDKDSLYIDDGEAQDKIKKIFDLRKTGSDAKKECDDLVKEVKDYPNKYINELGEPIVKFHSDEFNMELKLRKKAMSHEEFVKQLILLLPEEHVELIYQAEENARLNVGVTVQCTVEKRQHWLEKK